jgi:SET domain-containing protein
VQERKNYYRGIEVGNELRYLNHSETPNAGFWGRRLYAIRAIDPGDEITFDYTDGWESSG